nr:acyl carrier protein [uncultured Ruminococcus sp.]
MFEELKVILDEQLHLGGKEITLESRIKEDLGADSLDVLQMLMTIEEEKGIVIPDEELATFETVGDIVAYLEKNRK